MTSLSSHMMFRTFRTISFFFLSMFLCLAPGIILAQTPAIEAGVSWLSVNKNFSGSWGDPNFTEFRDTTVVADVLIKLKMAATEYAKAVSFIEGFSRDMIFRNSLMNCYHLKTRREAPILLMAPRVVGGQHRGMRQIISIPLWSWMP